MSFKRLFLPVLLLTACGSQVTTTPTEGYLDSLKTGDTGEAQNLQCVSEYDLTFPIVDSFAIQSFIEEPNDGIPYKEITATVDTPSAQETVVFREWITEDFYRDHVRHIDGLNEARDKLNSTLAEIGRGPTGERHKYLDKSQLSSNEYCTEVYLIPSRLGN